MEPILTIPQLLHLILLSVLIGLSLTGACLTLGWLMTIRIRRETAKYAADAQATMQAILAAVRRPHAG